MGDDWERVETGAPDLQRLQTARTVAEESEPLVVETRFDSPVDPQTLQLSMDAGIRAEGSRFDVTWTDRGYYKYHYTEIKGVDYRYDRHPRADVPENHFHEPPDAGHDAVPSCIEVEVVPLVTLAVLRLWRDAVESGDPGRLQQPDRP
jgi:hypothetical protein